MFLVGTIKLMPKAHILYVVDDGRIREHSITRKSDSKKWVIDASESAGTSDYIGDTNTLEELITFLRQPTTETGWDIQLTDHIPRPAKV